MAGLLEYRPEYFARQDEANAKMNRILREEQRIKPFMKGPAQGTNPIPSLIGGRNYGSGIIGIQRDPNELGLGGGIPDTTPLFTNMYGGEQEGLLASMGIRPEVLAQAKIQQQTANQPFSGTREQAYQMAMKKANEMGIPLELAAKQFKAAFPEAKAYTPQVTPYKETATGKTVYLDANKPQDIKKITGGGYEPYEKAAPTYGPYKVWEDVIDKRMKQLNSKYKLTGSEATDIDPNNPNALLSLFASKGLTADSAEKYLAERDTLENTRAIGYSDIEAGISPYKRLGSPKPKTDTFEQGIAYLKSAKDTQDAISKISKLRKMGWKDEQINELKKQMMTGR